MKTIILNSSIHKDAVKFIIVLGSIMSGLGKGIVTSSIGKILKSKGYNVCLIKFDGYLNVDCGTMNPFRHGEVFVLDDGTEVDMDFGTYERFLNMSMVGECSITGGRVFKRIIEKERSGGFLGRDVQFVPHVTDEIKQWIINIGEKQKADIVLIETGGTVGDIENAYFIEAMRQLAQEQKHVLFIQLTYVPSVSEGEQKTKPTQHANRLIKSLGINPKVIICREDEQLTKESREKISMYCDVEQEAVFDDPVLKTIYELPLHLEEQGMYKVLAKYLELKDGKKNLDDWERIVKRILAPKSSVRVGIVGKYTAVKDAYVSIKEALVHAGAMLNLKPEVVWIESTDIEKTSPKDYLDRIDGVLVPGGFGSRGVEGKINAIRYARENNIPYLGLCFGLQLMVIEYTRNVCGLKGANTTEVDEHTPHPVIFLLPEQKKMVLKGATMRLGSYECNLKKNTKTYNAYGQETIYERHRHRYEVNLDYVPLLEKHGLVIAGTHKKEITEVVEWKESFGIGTQFHPEFTSRLERPAPLFVAFLKACAEKTKIILQ